MDERASLLEETTKVLVKELNLKDNDMPALAAVDLEKSKLQDIISDIKTKQSIICNPSQKYRNIDGTCNNDMYPEVGSSFTCLHRILQPNYADGVSEPRKAISGEELPSPRLVSSTIHTDKDNPAHFTHFVMQWGQIIDHDLTFAPFSSFPEEELILGGTREQINALTRFLDLRKSTKYE
ncbi:salivary peroxidase/catechol oxidase-like [Tachypleus tridentatus]|uniref:salivary peroxidase/catechol oxidase-like n=1 Tax=Tachypleus tridentatus TaxID=6853 RepID=UPI003FD194CD